MEAAVQGEESSGAQEPAAAAAHPKARKKLDEHGRYVRFPGVTSVCHVPPASIEAVLSGLPAAVRQLPGVGECLAPLPAASYHVTVVDICTQYQRELGEEAWASLLAHSCWAEASALFERAAFVPSLRLKEVSLIYKHPKLLLGVNLEPAGPVDREGLLAAVREILEPAVGEIREPYCWHLTLAYGLPQLEQLAPLGPEALEAGREAAQRLVEEVLRGFEGGALPLEPARLCAFDDMTAFVPWNGIDPISSIL